MLRSNVLAMIATVMFLGSACSVLADPTNTTLYLNDTAGNLTGTYGLTLNVSAVSNITGLTVNITINGIQVCTGTTKCENVTIRKAGFYAINASTWGNATHDSSYSVFYANITKASPTLNLTLNGTANNKTYYYGQYINATSNIILPSNYTLQLFRNDKTKINNSNFNFNGGWNVSGGWSNQSCYNCGIVNIPVDNYSAYIETYYVGNFNQTIFITNGSKEIEFYFTSGGNDVKFSVWIDNNLLSNITGDGSAGWFGNNIQKGLFFNISNYNDGYHTIVIDTNNTWKCPIGTCSMYLDNVTIDNYTINDISILSPNTYNYSTQFLGNENYTSKEVWYLATVEKGAAPELNLSFNGTQENWTNLFPNNTVNITAVMNETDSMVIEKNGTVLCTGNKTCNSTQTLTIGIWNITAYSNGTNYNSTSTTYWINITNPASPTASNVNYNISCIERNMPLRISWNQYAETGIALNMSYINLTFPNSTTLKFYSSTNTSTPGNYSFVPVSSGTYTYLIMIEDELAVFANTTGTFDVLALDACLPPAPPGGGGAAPTTIIQNITAGVCGDGSCASSESILSCPLDCKPEDIPLVSKYLIYALGALLLYVIYTGYVQNKHKTYKSSM